MQMLTENNVSEANVNIVVSLWEFRRWTRTFVLNVLSS